MIKFIEPTNPHFFSLTENNLKIEFTRETQVISNYEYNPNKTNALFTNRGFFILDQSSENLIGKNDYHCTNKKIDFSNLERVK